jgi:hypothetical protein
MQKYVHQWLTRSFRFIGLSLHTVYFDYLSTCIPRILGTGWAQGARNNCHENHSYNTAKYSRSPYPLQNACRRLNFRFGCAYKARRSASCYASASPQLHSTRCRNGVSMPSSRPVAALVAGSIIKENSAESFIHREGVLHMKNVTTPCGIQMKWFAVLAGVFCLAMATGASAVQNAKPCAEDAVRLCQGMQPGGGRVAKCLGEHSGELSSACKDSMARIKVKAKSFRQACGQDARKFCKDEKRGGGRIMKCLVQHKDELSPACQGMMGQPIGGRKQQG